MCDLVIKSRSRDVVKWSAVSRRRVRARFMARLACARYAPCWDTVLHQKLLSVGAFGKTPGGFSCGWIAAFGAEGGPGELLADVWSVARNPRCGAGRGGPP